MRVPSNFKRYINWQKAFASKELYTIKDTQDLQELLKATMHTEPELQIKVFYDKKTRPRANKTCVYDSGPINKKQFLGTINTILEEEKHKMQGVLFEKKENGKQQYHSLIINFSPKTISESTINAVVKYNCSKL